MPKYGMTSRVENGTDVVLEKVFEASSEQVFEMFTKTEHLEHFWGPHGWSLIHSSMDFQPGGSWHYGMKCTDENQATYEMVSYGKMIYTAINTPQQITYKDYFTDEAGEVNEDMPVAETTMVFESLEDGRTYLTSETTYSSKEEVQALIDQGMLQGIAETWDRLTTYLDTIQ